jgi:hypothetical protein
MLLKPMLHAGPNVGLLCPVKSAIAGDNRHIEHFEQRNRRQSLTFIGTEINQLV